MKQKIVIISIFIMVLLLSVMIPSRVSAITSAGGYTIENYDINMVVNENNTFDITEKISVNFTGYNKHGIFRKIPLKNVVRRLDGTKSTNRAKISIIGVSEQYMVFNEDGYKVLKIGDSSTTVYGEKTYVIKYNYNIGKDKLKNEDELYFNLIGNEWDAEIENVTFNIKMPKPFNEENLGFSSGYEGSTNNANVEYDIEWKTITGSLNDILYPEEGLTVRLTLPDGYFVGATDNIDYKECIGIGISVIFVIIAFCLWRKYGKDDDVVDTVEFYPPEGLNSAELGYMYKGYTERKDAVSLLIYLANKGYLNIKELQWKANDLRGSRDFVIEKVKDYDGDNEGEKIFFNGLFDGRNKVGKGELANKFYIVLDKVNKSIGKKENREKIFEKSSLGKRFLLLLMIIIVFLFMGGWKLFKEFDELNILVATGLGFSLFFLYKKSNILMIILNSVFFVVVTFFCSANDIFEDNLSLVKFIIESISIILLILFLGIMNKRTKYGTQILGRIRGFKYFLETVEKPKLEELVMNDPEYFYNILPYTYVLGVSNKWMKKFEDIALEEPLWLYSYGVFSNKSFNKFMHSTYTLISTSMASTPTGSGNSGGGFSGGGSGGGGRRFLVILFFRCI